MLHHSLRRHSTSLRRQLVAPWTSTTFYDLRNYNTFTSIMSPIAPLMLAKQSNADSGIINHLLSASTSQSPSGSLVARQSEPSPSDESETSNDNGRSYTTYYFVFFALLFCIALLCVYFVWRRRRNALTVRHGFRPGSYQRNVQDWDTVRYRRRYWNTNFRNAGVSREEGLNEHGEAPPPYVPKDDENTGTGGPQAGAYHEQGQARPAEPAIPMQTLSRDQAGLGQKPPGYEQAVQPSGSRLMP